MTPPKTPAYITRTQNWDPAREHPALAWMENCTHAWDTRQSWTTPHTDWVTTDFVFVKPNGERCTGGLPAWEAMRQEYAAFAGSHHEPSWVCVVDCEDDEGGGWEFVGEGKLFIQLPDGKRPADRTVRDLDGREWDLAVESMFRFRFVRTPSAVNEGIRIQRFQFYSDSGPVVAEMLRREITSCDLVFLLILDLLGKRQRLQIM
ncbi:hypothetical protein BO86DRAFT_456343 [Aspergillus japonicus CBS 114.51]|uniref:Uncharacterized protein n=1 Tax=Aspergillus japonicus CBS 114.51 TaxID=1448312 RepID=A0A8T8X0A8_ASPJA|nr:hypothetical protein BO86DRAFT_456343 [Aspergillus japonicus CBS 114.51]RAH81568.1 hypothetical protein BO86DRAFT_456343 [Aspergillus japonicus CBS 114.51]